MPSLREQQLEAEVVRLKKQLQDDEELINKVAMKVEQLMGATATLQATVHASRTARAQRKRRKAAERPNLLGPARPASPVQTSLPPPV